MQNEFFSTLLLTFKLAAVTTCILWIIGIPLAYFLAYSKSKLKPLWNTLISMPLVLPPTVLGFYLLIAFSPGTGLGGWLYDNFNLSIPFTFGGLVVGSIIYSLPFMINPVQSALQNLPGSLAEASYTLGKSKFQTLIFVLLPNIKSSLMTATILTFAHTIGEFGVVLMIGGNIPGTTRVASIAIYEEVEALNYELAHQYAFTLTIITFIIILPVYFINNRKILT